MRVLLLFMALLFVDYRHSFKSCKNNFALSLSKPIVNCHTISHQMFLVHCWQGTIISKIHAAHASQKIGTSSPVGVELNQVNHWVSG